MPSCMVALLLPGSLFCLKAFAWWEANVCPGSRAPGKFVGVPVPKVSWSLEGRCPSSSMAEAMDLVCASVHLSVCQVVSKPSSAPEHPHPRPRHEGAVCWRGEQQENNGEENDGEEGTMERTKERRMDGEEDDGEEDDGENDGNNKWRATRWWRGTR